MSVNETSTEIVAEDAEAQAAPDTRRAVTARAVILGLAASVLVDFWIQYAELIMGGQRGHSALVNTAIPVGPFSVLFVLTALNLLCRGVLPSLAFSAGEVLTVYVMMTTSCVLSSSGQLQFLIPTLTAAWHYATPDNGWAGSFWRFVPHWMAQTDPDVLRGFYLGRTTVPVGKWLPQVVAWTGFMLALAGASLCVVAILRRQWVDRERLSFPTVALPLAVLQPGTPIFRQRLFWLGAALPFGISALNTWALNLPGVPMLNLRTNPVFQQVLVAPPWNAINDTVISFYPFVLGIAYFAPLDVSFSCWFFYLLTRVERLAGSEFNLGQGAVIADHASFPYLGNQGAGAFLGLTLISLFLARGYLKEVFLKAIGRNPGLDDRAEPIPYRGAFLGLVLCLAFMVGFCAVAGMNPLVAVIVILLGLAYMVAATRIRAETGDAWLFGPDVDVNTLVTQTFASSALGTQDLTIIAFLRPILANGDLRCITMPHQLEAFKMAQEVGASRRALTKAIVLATVLGLSVSFFIALSFWHGYGAEVRTEPWRTSQGRVPFDSLVYLIRNRPSPDGPGMGAVGFGFLLTAALTYLRTRFVWWPLHPIGYAIANTYTMSATWLPFLLAWLFKSLALRYGGSRFYRLSQPFFLGLIAGDLFGGGFFTALGALTGINVYPINW
ncbi:MAG: hypothetical protein JO250_03855 [Armatimonadetes bacterium]|nr:hypothetical protein [Armatimonadota bacterium]